jgi:cytochrome c
MMYRQRVAGVLLAVVALAPTASVSWGQDAGAGEAVFKRNCAICHTVEAGKNKIGPSLAGVAGRKAGTVPGYSYSDANKNSGDTWDDATLDEYLTDPRKKIPGTKMIFPGLKNPDDRKAVIAYLKQQK